MTRYLSVVERNDLPVQKQAKEFVQHMKAMFGTTKFAKNDYVKLLNTVEPSTVLSGSKAVLSATLNYYQNSLHEHGFIKLWEDDYELPNRPRKHDAFARKRTSSPGSTVEARVNKILEARLVEVTNALRAEYEAKLNELLK